ncbi:hypothetical protein RND81_08G223300 [Saponaria officinalis]|uniref:CCHC-type domain-containing protein n=1 Tax=Saponaria officinalis TaxID=3572 RepID=A0AAW1JB08_SAPOF
MAHIAKKNFEVLDVSGQKYPQWKDDIVAHLEAIGLEHIIEEGSWATHQEKQKGHTFIRHHMSEALKNEYIRVRDPNDLLKHLEARFGHHHDDKFTKFTDLIAVLLLSEQHDKILLKNDNIRPSGFTAIPKANAIAKFGHGRWNNKKGGGRGRGHGPNRKYNNFKKPRFGKGFTYQEKVSKPKGACLKCGLSGHWARACRTPKHFVDLYQASIKHDNKGPKTHFIKACLIDSGTTHIILKNKKYFSTMMPIKANVNTISGNAEIIEGAGKASAVLPMGTSLTINNALYSSKSQRDQFQRYAPKWLSH